MNESTTITIDNIVKLIEGIAKAEYQRGYVAGLEEKRLTEKHWGKDKEDKMELNNIIKNVHGSIENRIKAAYNLGKKDGMSKWIPVKERLPRDLEPVNITWINHNPEPYHDDIKDKPFTATGVYFNGQWYWWSTVCTDILAEYSHNYNDIIDDAIEIIAWMPLPELYRDTERRIRRNEHDNRTDSEVKK